MDVGLLVSKILGYTIVAGSLVLKAPQILKIVNAGSVAGLSTTSYWLELIGFTIGFAYNYNANFPLSTYGENIFLMAQDIIIVYLLYSYRRKINSTFFLMFLLYASLSLAVITGFTGPAILAYLQACTIPIFAASKIPQILNNYTQRSTGQLSFVTVFMTFGGSSARVFTTWKEVSDSIVLAGYLIGTFLNGILVLQFLLYSSSGKKQK